MRVTIVLSTSSGGVGRHVRSVVDRLPELGVHPHVIAPAATGDKFGFSMPQHAETAGGSRLLDPRDAVFTPVEIYTRPRPRQDLSALIELRKLLAGADVVHAHGFRAAALTGLALGRRRPGRTPLVATWHNAVLGSMPRRALLSGLERLAARRADVTLGASSDLVGRALALGAEDARLAPVAAPALPPSEKGREQMRAELGVGDRPVVLAVGRLAPQKDYDTLLAAVARWGHRHPQPAVLVAGDGPEMDRLRRDAENARIDIRFLGRRDDIADLLAAADVYVITSRWEARALVVQEAMRAGVPVVATAVGGLPELVDDDGILVPAGSAAAVSDAVVTLLDDDDLRRELAQRGRERSAHWPDEDATAEQLAGIYAELARVQPV
ncbi:glycosyltransferase family 4 protein [Phytoactinopolyspora halotolerans]|uniref:Glycosyltransferase family 4 protein n=1 Tax=Phytoactinopolyspora halotolerans TaxID=1981512 RepID=A0A6L9SK36_9ACTN|nr:glycosyltransferase family 4 protein [Phytoactinopolyspora halotolerans]NEE04691.1 glycosyltransferase family 4 protein [Phytoactinopolyspora halotolerans]